MPKKRIDMAIQDEISRLLKLGHSQRKVARILGINKETVNKYAKGPSEPDIRDIPIWVTQIDWDEVNKEINSKMESIATAISLIRDGNVASFAIILSLIVPSGKFRTDLRYSCA